MPSGVQGTLDLGSGFFRPLDKQEFFSRCGTVDLYSASGHAQRIYGDFALGNSTDHTIAGDENAKFDFNTNDVDFMDIFADLIKYWVAAADIDGLRLDAVAHVILNAFTAHLTHMRNYSASLGKDNFFFVGEITDVPNVQQSHIGATTTSATRARAAGSSRPARRRGCSRR